MYNEHESAHPQKLNRKNFEDWPSTKIGPHKNFPLYGTKSTIVGGISWTKLAQVALKLKKFSLESFPIYTVEGARCAWYCCAR